VKATHAIQPVALVGSVVYLAWLLFGYLAGVGGVQRHHVESASYILVVIAGWTAFTRVTPSSAIAAPEDALWWRRLPLFVAAAFVLYGSALGLGLFSDDFVLVERAAGGQWLDRTGFVRPLPTALWQAILAAGGGAVSLHAVNILLHGINAALLSRLGERIGLSRGEAVAAGIGVSRLSEQRGGRGLAGRDHRSAGDDERARFRARVRAATYSRGASQLPPRSSWPASSAKRRPW
jgi:hypothetical protein